MKLILIFITLPALCWCAGDEDWWKHAQLYQIYPRSYKDSNGDGIGDIKGITQNLQHLADSGVTATWISPIFVSPMKDFGYDIADFYNIAPEYGTKEDLIELIREANKLGIKILLDFVPNHTSDQCEWFKKSVKSEGKYADYYIWDSGKVDANDTRMPPSNWRSVFRGSAWTYHPERKQYYLHQFLPEQPDLNYRNPDVVEEMNNVMKYWLSMGASGFRVDAIPHLVEADREGRDYAFPDEPLSGHTDDEDDYGYLDHIHTRERQETWDVVYGWRKVADDFTRENGSETKILLMEAMSATEIVMQYYGNATHEGAHFPFNFQLTFLNKDANARNIVDSINHWFSMMPAGRVANWVAGNHDQKRITGRFGEERSDGIIMLCMLLPGISVTYQGEEIGMLNHYLSFNDTQDPQACNNPDLYNLTSRDPERGPFHWDYTENAGFSTNKSTWLPIPDNYIQINLKKQKEAEKSTYKMYKALSDLRREDVIINGNFEIKALSDHVLAFTRTFDGSTIVVVHNTRDATLRVDLRSEFSYLNQTLKVEVTSVKSNRIKGDTIDTDNLQVRPYESLVLRNGSNLLNFSVILSFVSGLFMLISKKILY